MGDAGLYYYYHTFAKALDAFGIDEIEDAKGVKHDWRRELTEELARRQKAERLMGQHQRPMDGRRPEPGDGLCAVGALLLPACLGADGAMSGGNRRCTQINANTAKIRKSAFFCVYPRHAPLCLRALAVRF